MDDRYFHGIIGCESVVCGRRLKRLTPWHVTILSSIDSPIVKKGVDIKPEDILVILKVISNKWTPTESNIPSLKPTLLDVYWLWRMKNRKVFKLQSKIFQRWLDIQLSTPKLWSVTTPQGNIEKSLTSPAMLALVVALVSKVNVTLREAWNMRLSEARWYDTCKAEIEGARLTIAYETDAVKKPGINDLPESEIVAFAKDSLSKEKFESWHKARKKNRKK